MRLKFDGPVPPPDQRYFRGPVLSTFDGREWTPLQPSFPAPMTPRADLRVEGDAAQLLQQLLDAVEARAVAKAPARKKASRKAASTEA